jgi:hypothetical protein
VIVVLSPPTAVGLSAGSSAGAAKTGRLAIDTPLDVTYPRAACPGGTPNTVECFTRTGRGIIRGLGRVDERIDYLVDTAPAGCGPDMVRVLPTTARFSVSGKGTIELRLDGSNCVSRVPPPLMAEAPFTITAGSGRYAGASGGGTYLDTSYGPPQYRGTDTWRGTLAVPGLDFDLTSPVLGGISAKVVRVAKRATRVRVRFKVTAKDDVDGALHAACRPKSGSWFRVGRTRVRCSATDTSGNERKGTLTVTVKRRR